MLAAHLTGGFELVGGLIAGADHGGPQDIPPIGRLTAGPKVHHGEGGLVQLLGHLGEQVPWRKRVGGDVCFDSQETDFTFRFIHTEIPSLYSPRGNCCRYNCSAQDNERDERE